MWLGGARDVLRALHPQGFEVLKERFDVLGRVLADGDTGGRGVADDLVVHVGDVHDVADLHAGQLEEAPEDVDLEEGAEVADVAVVVDGGPAGVHAQCLAVGGDEFVYLSGEGIEEAENHRSNGLLTVKMRRCMPLEIVAVGDAAPETVGDRQMVNSPQVLSAAADERWGTAASNGAEMR